MITIKNEDMSQIIPRIIDRVLGDKVDYKYQGRKSSGERFMAKIKKAGTVDLVGLERFLDKVGGQYGVDFHVEYPRNQKDIFWIEGQWKPVVVDSKGTKTVKYNVTFAFDDETENRNEEVEISTYNAISDLEHHIEEYLENKYNRKDFDIIRIKRIK